MNNTGIEAKAAIDKVLYDARGIFAFLTGSSAAAWVNGKPHAYTDIDIFVPNAGTYFQLVERLLNNGYSPESDRDAKTWRRHTQIGFKRWHTNSLKLTDDLTGTEINVVYKTVDGHETTRLSQVLESFDFGLLAVGFETKDGTFHDMRSYFFPTAPLQTQPGCPLGLLPYREEQITQGFMSQFVMLRTAGRYARYANEYGYDLSLVKPALIEGYNAYALYKSDRSKNDDTTLGEIAATLARHIEDDAFDELHEFERQLPKADGLDEILASLE